MSRGIFRRAKNEDMYSKGIVERRTGQLPRCLRCASRPCTGRAFLIANARLEINATARKQKAVENSNRERIAVSSFDFHPLMTARLTKCSTAEGSLIATFANSRIESTHCKQTRRQNSNSNKFGFWAISQSRQNSNPMPHFPIVFSETLRLRGATPCATLTLREPQSNLAASCFVRAFADEHS
jgi:hypothetical protein